MLLILHKILKHNYKVVKRMLNSREIILVLLGKVLYHITDNYVIVQKNRVKSVIKDNQKYFNRIQVVTDGLIIVISCFGVVFDSGAVFLSWTNGIFLSTFIYGH